MNLADKCRENVKIKVQQEYDEYLEKEFINIVNQCNINSQKGLSFYTHTNFYLKYEANRLALIKKLHKEGFTASYHPFSFMTAEHFMIRW